jgi:hypothetical protein
VLILWSSAYLRSERCDAKQSATLSHNEENHAIEKGTGVLLNDAEFTERNFEVALRSELVPNHSSGFSAFDVRS